MFPFAVPNLMKAEFVAGLSPKFTDFVRRIIDTEGFDADENFIFHILRVGTEDEAVAFADLVLKMLASAGTLKDVLVVQDWPMRYTPLHLALTRSAGPVQDALCEMIVARTIQARLIDRVVLEKDARGVTPLEDALYHGKIDLATKIVVNISTNVMQRALSVCDQNGVAVVELAGLTGAKGILDEADRRIGLSVLALGQ